MGLRTDAAIDKCNFLKYYNYLGEFALF